VYSYKRNIETNELIVCRLVVHTLPLVKRQQPTLLLAIMFAASRFWQSSTHAMIKQLLDNKISQAAITGNCHIATIQAIIILVFWQEPNDRSVWIKSGLAIRMAYQAGLHKVQKIPPLTSDDAGNRRLRVSTPRMGYLAQAYWRKRLLITDEPLHRMDSELGTASPSGCGPPVCRSSSFFSFLTSLNPGLICESIDLLALSRNVRLNL